MTRRQLVLLVALGAMWGAVYPLTSVVLRELPASAVVVGRAASAAVVLAPVAANRGQLAVARSRPLAVLGAALLQATLPLVLLTVGQEHVGSGVAGIILASQPVWAALAVSALLRSTNRAELGSIMLGLLGVSLLFVGDLGIAKTSLAGGAALLAAAMLFATGAVYIERVIPEIPPLTTATVAMAVSGVALTPFAVAAQPAMPDAATAFRLVALGVIPTGAALVLFYSLVHSTGAVRANLGGYLAPGFAVLYGAVFLDEQVSVLALTGLTMILVGSYMASHAAAP